MCTHCFYWCFHVQCRFFHGPVIESWWGVVTSVSTSTSMCAWHTSMYSWHTFLAHQCMPDTHPRHISVCLTHIIGTSMCAWHILELWVEQTYHRHMSSSVTASGRTQSGRWCWFSVNESNIKAMHPHCMPYYALRPVQSYVLSALLVTCFCIVLWSVCSSCSMLLCILVFCLSTVSRVFMVSCLPMVNVLFVCCHLLSFVYLLY